MGRFDDLWGRLVIRAAVLIVALWALNSVGLWMIGPH